MFNGIIKLTVFSVLISIVHSHGRHYKTLIVPENKTSDSYYSYSIKHNGGSMSEQNVTVQVVDPNNTESETIIKYPSKAKESTNSNKSHKYLNSQFKHKNLPNLYKTQEAMEQGYSNLNILKLPDNKILRKTKYQPQELIPTKQKILSRAYVPVKSSSQVNATTIPYDIITAPYNELQDQLETINQFVNYHLNVPEDVSTSGKLKVNIEQNRKSTIQQNNKSNDQIVSENQDDVHYVRYIPLEEQTTTSSIIIKQIDNGDNTEIDVVSNKNPNIEQLHFIEHIVKSIVKAAGKQRGPEYNIQSATEQSSESQFQIPAEISIPSSNNFDLNQASNYPLYPPLHDGQQFTNLPSKITSGTKHFTSGKPPIIFSASNKQSLVEQLRPTNTFFQQANENYQKYNMLTSEKNSYNQETLNYKPTEHTRQKSVDAFFNTQNKIRPASILEESPNSFPSYDGQHFQEHGLQLPEQYEPTYKGQDLRQQNHSHIERPNHYKHEHYANNYGYQNYPKPTPKPNMKFKPKQPTKRPMRKPQKPLKQILIIRKKPNVVKRQHIYLKKIVKPIRKLQVQNKSLPTNVIKVSILKHRK